MPLEDPNQAQAESNRGTEESAGTLASTVYAKLREDILAGKLAPGEKLRVGYLRERYKVGNSPLREALNRLSADGFVNRIDQKGFRVASTSRQELDELIKTRCWLESIAIREAIANRTDAWEEAIVLAFHRLSKVSRSSSSDVYTTNPEWERLHREFHMALIANCGSSLLLQFCAQMNDKADRYRQLAVATSYPKRNEKDEHRAIMDAALGGLADEAVELLCAHFRKTASIILESDLPDQA